MCIRDRYTYQGHTMKCYSFADRGVGLSRNNCLMRADGDLCVFADEDIVYRPGAARAIALEFEKNPKADMILFDMEVPQDRATYHIDTYGRVRWYNCGRYPVSYTHLIVGQYLSKTYMEVKKRPIYLVKEEL